METGSFFTIAGLLVVGTGLQTTGAIEYISRAMLGQPKQGTPLLRLIAPVSILLAAINAGTGNGGCVVLKSGA